MKTELDEHLDTINQNTSDIQEFNSVLSELDSKIDKLSERLDELELRLNPEKQYKSNIKLTPREQEVFMVLYLSKELRPEEIAKRLGFTTEMTNMYLFNIVSKGVPVKKELVSDLLVFSLDSEFKDLQARKNILEIDQNIASQIFSQDL